MIVNRDLDTYSCAADASIADLLRRINASEYLFQVVLDEAGRPVGTVTDGDIRRALVRGVALDGTARDCMFADPTLAAEADLEAARTTLSYSPINFLPLIDGEGRLSGFLIDRKSARKMPAALIMAGGYGSRLGQKTRNTPKPLLPVGGQPILGRIMDQLESAGIGTIHISVHYRADDIKSFVQNRTNKAAVQLVEETEKLGTAGSIALVDDRRDGPLIVLNGDVLTRTDLRSLVAYHEAHDHDLTMAIARYEVDVPYGVVSFNENGEFGHVDEKPKVPFQVCAGIYLLSPEVRSLVDPDTVTDMPAVVNRAKRIGMKVGVFPIVEYWRDIGRPDDLKAADDDYHSGGPGDAQI